MLDKQDFTVTGPVKQVENIKNKKLLEESELTAIESHFQTHIPEDHSNTPVDGEEIDLIPGEDTMGETIELTPGDDKEESETADTNTLENNTENQEDQKLKEEIRTLWRRNFKKYITTNINLREYNINIKPMLDIKYLKIADEIVEEELDELHMQYEIDL